MRTSIQAGAELDVLTQDELRTVLEETLSGYLRPPYRDRVIAGGSTDDDGSMLVVAYTVRRGFQFLLNRLEILPAGDYSWAAPYEPMDQGAVQILRNGEIVTGYPFGGGSGGSLPAELVDTSSHAIDFVDGEVVQVQIIGGPASTPFLLLGFGHVSPMPFS